jgi:hypothetical protein
MKRIALILILTGIVPVAHSQTIWSKDFTIELNNYYSEFPNIETVVDTIKVIGRKNTANGQRLLVVKYDLLGDTISTQMYGSDSVLNNSIIDYKFDNANNVYILHEEQLEFYKSKIVLQKYSLDGNLLWVEQIKSLADTSYSPQSLSLANDTSIFFTAHKEYDYPAPGDDVIMTTTLPYLYAYNSFGSQLWQREFDPNTEINWFANKIFVHNSTAFLFANNNSSSACLIKVDINNILTINTNTGITNGINDVQLTPDNNLLISAGSKYRISKANLTGSVIWTEYYGTNLPSNVSGDEIRATIQDADGNIYITGRHYGLNYGNPNYTNADILTIKYDSDGNLIWQNRFEYGVNNADIANTIVLKNGQVYVGGNSQRLGVGTDLDYIVLKIDSESGLWTGGYRYDGLSSGNDAIYSLSVLDNGNVALTGLSYINSTYDWTTQLLSDVVLSVPTIGSENKFQVYPNPSSGTFKIEASTLINKITLLDLKGIELESYSLQNSKAELESLQKPGIYLLKIVLENGYVEIHKIYIV